MKVTGHCIMRLTRDHVVVTAWKPWGVLLPSKSSCQLSTNSPAFHFSQMTCLRVIDIKCQSFIHLPRLDINRPYYCQPMMPMQPMHHYQAFESMNLLQYFPGLCACNNRSQGPWCPPSVFFGRTEIKETRRVWVSQCWHTWQNPGCWSTRQQPWFGIP